MIDQNMPRVKLPGNIIRTPVVPGPNSWALAQTQQPTINGLANNGQTADKSKYEKPMPEPPKTEVSLPRIMLESKSYIQPAIPLPVSLSNMKNTKNRAVTDPVPPKPLFAERKPSVNKLRRKYSASKLPEEILNDDSEKASDALMTVRLPPEKALQVLGLNPMQDNLQYLSRASTPAPIVMNPFGISYNDEQERSGTPVRQVQSTPAPTRCYLPENGLPTPSLVGPLDVSSPGPDERDRQKPSHLTDDFLGRVSENNLLCPPKVGVFGNVGESKTQIVQENGMQRIESFRGIIEDASANRSCIDRTNVNITGQASRLDLSRGQGFGNIYMEAPYDVGGYGGVWEHDPAVVSISLSFALVNTDVVRGFPFLRSVPYLTVPSRIPTKSAGARHKFLPITLPGRTLPVTQASIKARSVIPVQIQVRTVSMDISTHFHPQTHGLQNLRVIVLRPLILLSRPSFRLVGPITISLIQSLPHHVRKATSRDQARYPLL